MNFILIFPLITLAIFLISYLNDKRKLINGFLFNLFIFSVLITFTYIAFASQSKILIILFLILFLLLLIVITFGIYALVIGLFINAKIVMKKESKKLPNLLTLFLGIALLLHAVLVIFNPGKFLSPDLNIFLSGFVLVEIYFLFSIFNFLMISFISQFNRPKKNQDFIIVLGSRVIGDKVPPLLASRIDKAIKFYNEQSIVNSPPKIIFSGGQGPDEMISEGLAMKKYAISKGIPKENTLVEDKSVKTLQNMKFSKSIMDKLMPNGYKSIFVTNNYHVFRAGLYSKMANLNSQGIGSKTALYFLPNALIREYIAIIMMHKKRNLIVIALCFLITAILSLINYFFVIH